jgi:hypothetical protein
MPVARSAATGILSFADATEELTATLRRLDLAFPRVFLPLRELLCRKAVFEFGCAMALINTLLWAIHCRKILAAIAKFVLRCGSSSGTSIQSAIRMPAEKNGRNFRTLSAPRPKTCYGKSPPQSITISKSTTYDGQFAPGDFIRRSRWAKPGSTPK